MTTLPPTRDDLERRLHQLHRDAVQQLSPATLRRLQQARQAAHAGARDRAGARGRWTWMAATACSAVLAVTVGLQLHRDDSAAPTAAAVQQASTEASALDVVDAYEESPDLYLWLGSDSQTLAME